MARKYRVKHYYGKISGSYRARPHPLTVIFTVLVLAGLVYIGTVIYGPVNEFIMNVGKIPETVQSEPESRPPVTSEPDPEPEPPPKPEPPEFKAVYLPHATASDAALLDAFLENLAGTEINAVMVDIKDAQGNILFVTENEKANEWGAVSPAALDLKAFSEKLADKGFHLIARMHAFRDPLAASRGRNGYAINYQNSEWLWLDAAEASGGKPWLNPYSPLSKAYLLSIASEAVDAGAKMVVLDSVQFPDGSAVQATFGENAAGVTRAEALSAFVSEMTDALSQKDARVCVYFQVTAVSAENEIRYGGAPVNMVDTGLLLGLMPEQLAESAFAAGAGADGSAASLALKDTNEKLAAAGKQAATVALISDIGQAADLNAAGAREYILYNPDGVYELK